MYLLDHLVKVIIIGLVHNGSLFPKLQNERRSGNNVGVMVRLSVEPSRAAKFAWLKWHSILLLQSLDYWPFTICSSSHFLSTSFSGRRSMLKASMHGRSTATITRVSANFIIVSCRLRDVAMTVATENNAIWTQHFHIYTLSQPRGCYINIIYKAEEWPAV